EAAGVAGGVDNVTVLVSGWSMGANVEIGVVGLTSGTTLTANDQGAKLYGNVGNDALTGGAGNDYISGGAGNDTMAGGNGDDAYVVDSTGDVVTEAAGASTGTADYELALVTGVTLGANVEIGAIGIGGGATLTGNAQGDTLYG